MEYSRNLDEMTLDEINELCENPSKYGLKWGEYIQIMKIVSEAAETVRKTKNPEPNADNIRLKKDIISLKLRVEALEKKLNRLGGVFMEEDDE